MGRIISFSNQKGGIGKTTSAVNIAACVAKRGKKVLLCDIDPQGNATSGVGINKNDCAYTVYDLLIGACKASDAVIKTEFKNLSVIASNIALAGAELEFVELEDREERLKKALDEIKGDYDLIVIDCPPSLGLLTVNALTASDGIIIPMTCEYYSLEGLSQLVMTIRSVKAHYNPSLDIVGILITMYDKRLNLSKAVLDEVEKYYAEKLFKTYVARNVRLCEAPSYGKPAIYYDKHSKGAVAYDKIASELIKRIF